MLDRFATAVQWLGWLIFFLMMGLAHFPYQKGDDFAMWFLIIIGALAMTIGTVFKWIISGDK